MENHTTLSTLKCPNSFGQKVKLFSDCYKNLLFSIAPAKCKMLAPPLVAGLVRLFTTQVGSGVARHWTSFHFYLFSCSVHLPLNLVHFIRTLGKLYVNQLCWKQVGSNIT